MRFLGYLIAVYFVFSMDVCHAAVGATADAKDMILIPSGDFLMGSDSANNYSRAESPAHKVYTNAFYIDVYEVTNSQFAEFLNAAGKGNAGFEEQRRKWIVIRNDLSTEEKKNWWPAELLYAGGRYKAVGGSEKNPVVSLSWPAADAYCRWRGKRLPTEAEWEKAARGGLQDKDYPWGNELPTDGIIFRRDWKDNALPAPTEKVGNYHPNGYGVYDMAGNVSEWCADWYSADYYGGSPRRGPKGPDSGSMKVIRGGSWSGNAKTIRVGARSFSSPDSLNSGVGFRCVKDPSP